MIWIFKILFIFEVQATRISNDANTETKTKRELTVESTAVIHTHRVCVACRDSLPLFNQKSFIMQANDERNCRLCRHWELVDKLIGFDWTDNVPGIKNTLQELLLAYVRGELIEGTPIEAREAIAFHMWLVNFVLDTLLEFKKNNPENKAA
jgi:acyl carrier protein phosphodiesterase